MQGVCQRWRFAVGMELTVGIVAPLYDSPWMQLWPAFQGVDMAGGERKLVIKATDMSDDMQQDAVDCALQVRKRMHAIHTSVKSM